MAIWQIALRPTLRVQTSLLKSHHSILSKSQTSILSNGLQVSPKITRGKATWTGFRDKVFGKYLLLTNTLGSGILMAVGDLIQQNIEFVQSDGVHHADGFDWTRTTNMSIIGFVQGPPSHYFYQWLDKQWPGTALRTVARKIMTDQLIASPFCILLFFIGMNFLSGETFATSRQEIKDKFLVVYATDCSVWIPSQFINFFWIGPKYRVMYINLVTMCYNVFLSFIKHVDQLEA